MGLLGFEVLVRLQGDFQQDQIDGSGDPQRGPGQEQVLETVKAEMALTPHQLSRQGMEHVWGQELTTLRGSPSPRGAQVTSSLCLEQGGG